MIERQFVGALILNPKNEILLQRKNLCYKKWPGFWTTFGGEVDETDKDPSEALHREVILEETGSDLFERFYKSLR